MGSLAPAFAAVRSRLAVVAALLAVAGVSWWSTVDRMRGMDDGPWSGLGTFGWFLGAWVVMMAAMMFPAVAPTVALYSRMTVQRSRLAPLCSRPATSSRGRRSARSRSRRRGGSRLAGDVLAWDRAGRWLAGATLLAAAAYELTPLKDVCLRKCRSPLGYLLGAWRVGWTGALRMGAGHGAWCVGCCWALMASLFALGVMSTAWMVFVAALIAAEKLCRGAGRTYGTAALLLALGILLLVVPDAIPGLTITGHDATMQMRDMRP